MNNHGPLTPKEVPHKGVHACDVRGPVDCTFQDMSNANVRLAQVSMPIIKTGLHSPTRLGLIKVPVSGSLCFFPCECYTSILAGVLRGAGVSWIKG